MAALLLTAANMKLRVAYAVASILLLSAGGAGAAPTPGDAGREAPSAEARVETVVPEQLLADVLLALKEAHPYEEPAYDVYPLRDA